MNEYFRRALIGFFAQVFGLYLLAGVGLWALTSLIDAPWWALAIVIVVVLAVSIGIYGSTLHNPIYDWIRDGKEVDKDRVIWPATKRAIADAILEHERKYHQPPGVTPHK